MNRIPALARVFLFMLCGVLCTVAGGQGQDTTSATAGTDRQQLTPAQWREDLQFALEAFLARDRSFSSTAREQFRSALAELQRTVDTKTDNQVIVELAKAVALAKNAHTRLYLLRNRTELRRYPIRVWWFADGLYVVRAKPEFSDLLGARILKIAGRTVGQVKQDVAPLFAGNASWRTYMSAYTMTSPDVFIGLGLVHSDGQAEIQFVNRQGKKGKRWLQPLPLRRSAVPTESWWDLCPTRPRDDDSWTSALSLDAGRLPLYLQKTERQYWSQYLAAEQIFYIQFNRSGNAPTGESLGDFGKRALAELQATAVKKIVVDVRFNTGGDLSIGRLFIEKLAAFAKTHQIKVYVITGRATFSAGIYHAMQLRQYGNAILVGEPIGDVLEIWSEGGNLLTPNSRLTLHYADRLHSYSPLQRPDFKQYLVTDTDLSITNPLPDILVRMSARQYFAGGDPAFEAIRSVRY
jgi:hypothetical protein